MKNPVTEALEKSNLDKMEIAKRASITVADIHRMQKKFDPDDFKTKRVLEVLRTDSGTVPEKQNALEEPCGKSTDDPDGNDGVGKADTAIESEDAGPAAPSPQSGDTATSSALTEYSGSSPNRKNSKQDSTRDLRGSSDGGEIPDKKNSGAKVARESEQELVAKGNGADESSDLTVTQFARERIRHIDINSKADKADVWEQLLPHLVDSFDDIARHAACDPKASRTSVELLVINPICKRFDCNVTDVRSLFRERWKIAEAAAKKSAAAAAKKEAENAQQRVELSDEEKLRRRQEAEPLALPLIECEDVFGAAHLTMAERNVVNELPIIDLVLTSAMSRILDKPLSAVIKGDSGSGKSYVTGIVLDLIPPERCMRLSSFSPMALVYEPRDYSHTIISLAEATPIRQKGADDDNMAAGVLRTLISENKLIHSTVVTEPGSNEKTTVTIEREGPISFLVTTTHNSIDAEMDTRCVSLKTTETPEQTRDVFHAIAQSRAPKKSILTYPLEAWHAFNEWLELGPNKVTIPFSNTLATMASNKHVRFRRDFNSLLTATEVSALLHQRNREIIEGNVVVATLVDYAHARRVLLPTMDETTGHELSEEVKRLVDLIKTEIEAGRRTKPVDDVLLATGQGVAYRATSVILGRLLGVSASTAHRRVREACDNGLLVNIQKVARQEMLLVPADKVKLEVDEEALPTVEELELAFQQSS